MSAREEQDVRIRLYRFKAANRWRWAARLDDVPGAMEAYGALPDEALQALVDGIDSDDRAALLAAAQAGLPSSGESSSR